MLEAIFYARFHPERGPSVIHQHPPNAIVSALPEEKPLFQFSDISAYVIPAYELCGQPLSICVESHRVLGFPVSLEDESYERNRFTFNVCYVLSEEDDWSRWDRLVSKTARFFTELEETDGLLQNEEKLSNLVWAGEKDYPNASIGIVYQLLRSTFEMLSAYDEACVRVGYEHVLNLKLGGHVSDETAVSLWEVPLLVRPIASSEQWTWNFTLQRIHSHINGLNHVQRICELADVEPKLALKAIRELKKSDRVILLDIFHFQACYTLTNNFALFIGDTELVSECMQYVTKHENGVDQPSWSTEDIASLYRGFLPGITVRDFVATHESQLADIDVRRLITFAVIKGFLRRLHKYVLSAYKQQYVEDSSQKSFEQRQRTSSTQATHEEAWKRAAFSSGWTTPPFGSVEKLGNQHGKHDILPVSSDDALETYLNGQHCMDEICVKLHRSERQILESLRSSGSRQHVVFSK